ncbi:quinone-dependent dihydroorotate dehydrogenase [Alginatibacterium sediminis]|uniref:Dihydroorotate dehydrogenase (quinone) n=1 Tax=Alginatibacterium sediminis TaxID=2164068 RepID=A0A420EHL2_9ALTE|nr:quinone-dependent dihydroorotate dehydrogenase [Alginatibacterium sediminis]RKF20202.1 quinone-dependent dihydroorotate dehydrogenase [Alginatibacterium sediminis]
MYYPLAKSLMFQLDPEKAHDLIIDSFKRTGNTPLNLLYKQNIAAKPVSLMGLEFPNPVGLAAGLDKNGECIDAFAAMGFGFVEVGTVTPRAQSGNDKPRIFRLVEAEGLINRMGFNNKGIDYLIEQVKQSSFNGILGINIGKNFDTPVEHGKDDYLIGMEKAFEHASYIAVNISSPNTPGLRNLQYGEALEDLLKDLTLKKDQLSEQYNKHVPLLIKIAPDLEDNEIEQISDALIRYKLDGVIATNTTLDRQLVKAMKHGQEAGGLSGRPLQNKSTVVISKLYKHLGDTVPIIGVGGIDSAIAAKEKIEAGAKLVQLYSGFIYKGPGLIKKVARVF